MAAKPFTVLLAALVLLIVLGGCWSRKEIEDLAIVTVAGLDKLEVSGQEKWRTSFQVVKPAEMGAGARQQGGDKGGEPVWLTSGRGDTIADAGRNVSLRSPRDVFLAHTNLLVLGEGAAREGVRDVMDLLVRDPRFRLRSWLLVAEGDALEVLRAQPELEKLLSQEMMGMVQNTQPRVSRAYVIDLKDFVNQLISPGRDPVASRIEVFIPGEEKPAGGGEAGHQQGMEKGPRKSVRLSGSAVFRKDQLVGWLGERETMGYLFAINEARGGVITLSAGEYRERDVSFMLTRSRSKITPGVREGLVTVNIDIKAEGDLGEHAVTMPVKQTTIEVMEKDVAREIKRMVENTVRVAQEEYNADIFGIGNHIHRKYPGVWKTIEKDWQQIYPTVQVSVNVEAKIRRTGMVGDTPEIR